MYGISNFQILWGFCHTVCVVSCCILIPLSTDSALTCKTVPFTMSKDWPSKFATLRVPPTLKFAEEFANEIEGDVIDLLSEALT